jgi:hypothetical protein
MNKCVAVTISKYVTTKLYGTCTVIYLEKSIECDTEKATQRNKFTKKYLIEELDLEISDDKLAEALLQLREVFGPERRWTMTMDANSIVGPGPIVVGKKHTQVDLGITDFFYGAHIE